jgi:ParB family chromosome partitioning protein
LEKRLGRGLSSLLGGSGPADKGGAGTGDSHVGSEIPVIEIRPNPHQPREAFDTEGLEELRDSIRTHGVLQAVILRRAPDGYELIAGERRWRAARLAGKETIPAVVREDVSEEDMLELALVENVQRRDLDALEKARGYRRMMERLGLTQAQVAKKVGLKRATVSNHIRLLELGTDAQEALAGGLISMGHARALLGESDPEKARATLESIVRDGLSVRATEARVRGAQPSKGTAGAGGAGKKGREEEEPKQEPWAIDLQRQMQIHLGTKVKLQSREGFKGRIVIEFYGREDLDRLVEVLAPKEGL